MDMITVKRNGIFISFPKFECKNGDVRDNVISGAQVNNAIGPSKRRNVSSKKKPVAYVGVDMGCTPRRTKSVIEMKVNTRKRCMKCGELCWRSDVNYCWDCYKYEMFESR